MFAAPLKILLVEDNPGDARLIREMLAEAGNDLFTLEWSSTLAAGLDRLSRSEIDLVLLDLGLPDSLGLDTFVKAYAHAPQVPFVVLSGLSDETLALTAVRQGAQDYLFKHETDSNQLLRAIRYATERKQTELALEAERKKLYSVLNSLPAYVYLKGPISPSVLLTAVSPRPLVNRRIGTAMRSFGTEVNLVSIVKPSRFLRPKPHNKGNGPLF